MKKKGFTLIELLTVISIIVVLMAILAPGVAVMRRQAKVVSQQAMFRNISVGLEAFKNDHGDYPDSDAKDINGDNYCGAMKLTEALVGQDGLGFHPDSKLTAKDQTLDEEGTLISELYPPSPGLPVYPDAYVENLRKRTSYVDHINVKLYYIIDSTSVFSVADCNYAVLGDVFNKVKNTIDGKKYGMPILYYKAKTGVFNHNIENPDDTGNIYNYKDNHELVRLGVPYDTGTLTIHPQFQKGTNVEGQEFYRVTTNPASSITIQRPYNIDSYILQSAGADGLYGTEDDVFNFQKQ